MDVFATYWQHLTQIVGWDDAGISGGRGGYGKIGNCSDITYLTTESLGWKHMTVLLISTTTTTMLTIFVIVRVEEFSLVISVENAFYLNNGLC